AARAREDPAAFLVVRVDVVADQAEYAAQTRFAGRSGDRIGAALSACAGIADRRESAAQRLQCGKLRSHVHQLFVEAALERHPDAPKYLRRFAEGKRFAER